MVIFMDILNRHFYGNFHGNFYGQSNYLNLNSLILSSVSVYCVLANSPVIINHQQIDDLAQNHDQGHIRLLVYTLLKSDVTTRDHVVRCRGSQECGSRNVNFACKFHRRSHRVRITLKSTTFLFMRSKNM